MGDDTIVDTAPPLASLPATRRSVRVRTDVAALAKSFDYAVPDAWTYDVRVGTRVRVPLHGRSVRGWVVADGAPSLEGVDVLPLKSWLGWGPPARAGRPERLGVVALGRPAVVLLAGGVPAGRRPGPPRAADVPGDPSLRATPAPAVGWEASWAAEGTAMVRLPPTADLIDLVLTVLGRASANRGAGTVLVLVPSTGWATRLSARLVRRGYPVAGTWEEARAGWPVVVGSRAAAWAPLPHLAAAVVLDAHDAAYREESAPTYSAVDVVMERARRAGVPCVLASPIPPVSMAALTGLPTLSCLDDPGASRLAGPSSRSIGEAPTPARACSLTSSSAWPGPSSTMVTGPARGPLVCVYNRTGGARLLACRHCGELARCDRCGAAVRHPRGEDVLHCPTLW